MFFKFFGTFFLDKELYINIKKISITPSLCTNIMTRTSLDIKDTHSKKKKKRKRKKKDPATMINHLQQSDPNYQYNTQNYGRGASKTMPPKREQCTSTVHYKENEYPMDI